MGAPAKCGEQCPPCSSSNPGLRSTPKWGQCANKQKKIPRFQALPFHPGSIARRTKSPCPSPPHDACATPLDCGHAAPGPGVPSAAVPWPKKALERAEEMPRLVTSIHQASLTHMLRSAPLSRVVSKSNEVHPQNVNTKLIFAITLTRSRSGKFAHVSSTTCRPRSYFAPTAAMAPC